MTDYTKSKIYKITSCECDDVYIGSTTKTLKKRLSGHKSNYKMWLAGKGHRITSFDIVKYSSCEIELVENFPCESKAAHLGHGLKKRPQNSNFR